MFQWLFATHTGKILMTFIISMVPVIELRGAIPYGVGWGLSPLVAMLVSIVGNMLPIPFILLFIRKILDWMKEKNGLGKIVDKLEKKAQAGGEKVMKYKILGLAIFVAIPLPGTGAWSGALAAAFLGIRFKKAIPAIFLGVIIASIIVTLVTYGITALF